MVALVVLVAALPEQADDLDGLFEHVLALVRCRPAGPDHVLVEVLAGAHAEEEATRHHRSCGGGRMGDDRRVGADGRAGDARTQAEVARGLGDGADHAPHERALPLAVGPRVEVVRDQGVLEAGHLAEQGLAHQLQGRVLLARQCQSDRLHGAPPRLP